MKPPRFLIFLTSLAVCRAFTFSSGVHFKPAHAPTTSSIRPFCNLLCKSADNPELKTSGDVPRRAALFAAVSSFFAPKISVAEPEKDNNGEYWDSLLKDGKISRKTYEVMHLSATERPFTSDLLKEKRQGVFICASCGTQLFATKTKFDSGTGWPSFYDKLAGVELEKGNVMDQYINLRSEVHCQKCKGHLGHVFDDGIIWNVPTGKRYCINGVSLSFVPDQGSANKPI